VIAFDDSYGRFYPELKRKELEEIMKKATKAKKAPEVFTADQLKKVHDMYQQQLKDLRATLENVKEICAAKDRQLIEQRDMIQRMATDLHKAWQKPRTRWNRLKWWISDKWDALGESLYGELDQDRY